MPFSLAPVPQWHFTDSFGKLAVGGGMFTYSAADRSVKKAVFKDIAGVAPWTNPVRYNGAGASGPFYWDIDEAYYVEFRASTDPTSQLIWYADNYIPGGGGGSPVITVNQDLENYVNNAQFREQFPIIASPLPIGPFKIAPDQWYFRKSSATATDGYTFETTSPGEIEPDPNTLFWLKYTASAIGTPNESFKDFEYRLRDVRTFQNQTITLSFMVRASGNMIGSNSDIVVTQFFGTGGTPSAPAEQVISGFATTSDWVPINIPFVIPSITGKVLGSAGDDYMSVALRLPLNTTDSFEFVNFQIQEGTIASPAFIYQSKIDTQGDLQQQVNVSATDQEPQFLEQKLVAGPGVTITKETTADIETLKFSSGGVAQFLSNTSFSSTSITGTYTGTSNIPKAACNLLTSVTITPTSASSRIYLQGNINNILQSTTTAGTGYIIGAFFRSTGGTAITGTRQYTFVKFLGEDIDFQTSGSLQFMFVETAGTTSPITYELRASSNNGGTITVNDPGYGSTSGSILTVTEHLV